MRIVAIKTLRQSCVKYPMAKDSLLSWNEIVESSKWNNPNELKAKFNKASIISDKRVVFNIHGNKFRLIVDVEYQFKIVFFIWFGTHKEYDIINVKTIKNVKTN